LIDTLAYNFIASTDEYDDRSYFYYDWMCRDFFKFLADQPKQSEYAALGSRQRVRVKKRFEAKAKTAYDLCLKAIEATGQKNERQKWRDVFGNAYPAPVTKSAAGQSAAYSHVFKDTEQFVEDRFRVDVRYHLRINCEVTQDGFRPGLLRDLLERHGVLLPKKNLRFFVAEADLPLEQVDVFWKVLNRGDEAERRDMMRGQIMQDQGKYERHEATSFRGDHLVECYVVYRGVVVARDSILVPISIRSSRAETYAA
jgi:hypothetical protein